MPGTNGRLPAPGTAAGGAESGRICGNSGAGQVDLQHQRPTGSLSERPDGTAATTRSLSTRDTASMPGTGSLSTSSLGGVFAENTVYRGVTGWESFEPWLSRIENLAPETVVGDCGGYSAGMVWRGSERVGGLAEAVAGAPGAGERADCGVRGIGKAAVSELGRGGRGGWREGGEWGRDGCKIVRLG